MLQTLLHACRHTLPAAALLLLSSCGSSGGGGAQGQGAPSGPPPLVEVMIVQSQPIPNIVELPGRIQPVRMAEVRARTDGIVERRLYQEGTDVAAGTPLFRIDPKDLTAQVQQARATLARAQAARTNAQQIVRRYSPLVDDRSVSAMEYEQAQSNARQADAAVLDARAALDRTQIQLGYTIVRAPIAGRVGIAQVTEGALVSASSATLLTTVEQLSSVYAVFTQSSAGLLDLAKAQRTGAVSVPKLSQIEVKLILADGQEHSAIGRLDFAAQTVDPSTGSQILRAIFPNDAKLLLPGQFVRGRISLGTLSNGIMIPAKAVQIGQNTASVSVVGRDGAMATRTVQLGSQTGANWIILSGLKAGERVITDGWQKVQPGQPVRVKGEASATGRPNQMQGR